MVDKSEQQDVDEVPGKARFGHNRPDVPDEELAKELEELRAAELKSRDLPAFEPQLLEYIYEVRFYPGANLIRGELQAFDVAHAERVLHVILGLTRLPMDTRIVLKDEEEERVRLTKIERNRRALRKLTSHHHWLQGSSDGVRADFAGENLADAVLEGRDLSHVSLANARLAGAKLAGSKLVGADLSGADLSGADLSGADLTNATLAEANLIGANLLDAKLDGADVWRANLARIVISVDDLHKLLGCKSRP